MPHDLNATIRHRAWTILLCHCFNSLPYGGGTGMSTRCPSTTPFGLALVPDLPWVDEPSPGNLRLSTMQFLTAFSLLMPAFSLVSRPRPLPLSLLPQHIAPLPIRFRIPKLRCIVLAPIIFGAPPLDQ